ncbi:sugar ABC transporter permease [Nonomuraea sp. KC401]|uniref:carbohydrate ABC transporter permease n=1 Tax=unclassified Nonomuraea TaxID=2593643 RepID=UPI0010FE59EE|nr:MULTISPECIES: sugar ABC transporter permease [unclassified Nonomuraea]NBE97986.1 ABC transporter permease subunit [Nonomuraea sp. K271]TLF55328.1 sugar ABC transporter permease [Nonomuraea sp. KC401]
MSSVTRKAPSLAVRIRSERWAYVFLLPTLLLFGAYTVWPIISSLYYSMLDWKGLGAERPFVGLANYREAFGDPLFWKSLGVTLTIIAVTVPLRVGLSLLTALVLNNPRLPLARVFRTALFVPAVTTTAIIGVVMGFIFDPAGGPVNQLLLDLGIVDQPVDFLGDPGTSLWTVMGVHMWKWFGITLVYWLAALQTIPTTVYEAARTDGAGGWAALRHVTLPLLRPFLIIIVLLTAIETMQIFDLVLTMTNGGPFFSTLATEVYIYQQAFAGSTPRLGYGAALGVLFGLVTLVFAALQAVGIRYADRVRSRS